MRLSIRLSVVKHKHFTRTVGNRWCVCDRLLRPKILFKLSSVLMDFCFSHFQFGFIFYVLNDSKLKCKWFYDVLNKPLIPLKVNKVSVWFRCPQAP